MKYFCAKIFQNNLHYPNEMYLKIISQAVRKEDGEEDI